MQLYSWKSRSGNVGDDLNHWLWPKVFGSDFFNEAEDTKFFGIGSILDKRHKEFTASRKIIFGSGVRNRYSIPRKIDLSLDIRFVRGPNSAKVLSRYEADFISDPAIITPLFSNVTNIKKETSASKKVGFVPYFQTPLSISENICAGSGLELISPKLPVEEFIKKIVTCDYIISEAMHGAIIADAFRKPWVGCRLFSGLYEGRTSLFKWEDWLGSMQINTSMSNSIHPVWLYMPHSQRILFEKKIEEGAIDQIGKILTNDRWTLSNESVFQAAQEKILDKAKILGDERL